MITQYLQAAMAHAKYDILADGTYYGEIPDLQGVWANAVTLENCRAELQEVLEGWIVLGLRLGHQLPIIDGINLWVEQEVA